MEEADGIIPEEFQSILIFPSEFFINSLIGKEDFN